MTEIQRADLRAFLEKLWVEKDRQDIQWTLNYPDADDGYLVYGYKLALTDIITELCPEIEGFTVDG
jgi:hypothetical protein